MFQGSLESAIVTKSSSLYYHDLHEQKKCSRQCFGTCKHKTKCWDCDSGRQWERPKSPGPENTQKLLKGPKMAHPLNYLEKLKKTITKKMYFGGIFSIFWVFFQSIWGWAIVGLFLVIFEYFRVRGIWVSLTGALNRNAEMPSQESGSLSRSPAPLL